MNAGLKKLIVYSAVFIAGVTLGSIGMFVLNQPAGSDQLLMNMTSKYLSKERGKSSLTTNNRYNISDTVLASREHRITKQKKKIDKLLDRVSYQEETIELLQEILNENTLPPDTSLGNFVYQELEGLGLADEEILKLMQNFISINYEDIPTYMSIKDFTTKLIDIASEGILKNTLHESTHGQMAVNKIEFCSSVQDNLPIDPRDVFKSNDSKIFATFKTDQITDNAVLAKWYRVDSPQIYLFDRFPIDPNKDSNYVWLDTKGQADAGQYTVEIYSINDGLDPIASGEYAIVNSTPDIIAFEGRFL